MIKKDLSYVIYAPIYLCIWSMLVFIYGNTNDPLVKYILFFWAWVFLQALLFIPKFDIADIPKFLKNIFFSLSWLFPIEKAPYNIYLHLFFVYLLFIIFFTITFAKKIIWRVSEINIYCLTIFLWYLIPFKLYLWNNYIFFGLMFLLSVSSIFVIKSIYTKQNSDKEKLSLYVMYIFMLIFLGIMKIVFWEIEIIVSENFWVSWSYFDIFIIWTFFSYALTYLVFSFQMLPISFNKELTKSELKQRIQEYKWILIENFTEKQLSTRYSLIILMILVILFIFDFYIINLSNSMLITIIFIFLLVFQQIEIFFTTNKEDLCQ